MQVSRSRGSSAFAWRLCLLSSKPGAQKPRAAGGVWNSFLNPKVMASETFGRSWGGLGKAV